MAEREDWRRYVAPAAFLVAVTVAVVLVRSGLEHGKPAGASSPPAATTHKVVVRTTRSGTVTRTTTIAAKRYWVVKAGDTFAVIAAKTGVPVATIQRLNPKVSSTSLYIGERIRYQ